MNPKTMVIAGTECSSAPRDVFTKGITIMVGSTAKLVGTLVVVGRERKGE